MAKLTGLCMSTLMVVVCFWVNISYYPDVFRTLARSEPTGAALSAGDAVDETSSGLANDVSNDAAKNGEKSTATSETAGTGTLDAAATGAKSLSASAGGRNDENGAPDAASALPQERPTTASETAKAESGKSEPNRNAESDVKSGKADAKAAPNAESTGDDAEPSSDAAAKPTDDGASDGSPIFADARGAKAELRPVSATRPAEPTADAAKSLQPTSDGAKSLQPTADGAKSLQPTADGAKSLQPTSDGAKSLRSTTSRPAHPPQNAPRPKLGAGAGVDAQKSPSVSESSKPRGGKYVSIPSRETDALAGRKLADSGRVVGATRARTTLTIDETVSETVETSVETR